MVWLFLFLGIVVFFFALGVLTSRERNDLSIVTIFFNGPRAIFLLPVFEKILFKLIPQFPEFHLLSKIIPNYYQYKRPSSRKITRDEINYNLDIGDFIDWHIYYGLREGPKAALYDLVKPNQVILDIGANIGETVLNMAKLTGAGGRVIGFEPDPTMRAKLLKNISLNSFKNIEIEPFAVSHSPGRFKLFQICERNPAGNQILAEGEGKFSWVDAITIDSYLEKCTLAKIDLIKMDVEGFEMNALRGAEASIKKLKPVMFIEVSEVNLRGQSSSSWELMSWLLDRGYDVRQAHNQKPIYKKEDIEEQHLDLICVPRST